MVELLMKHRPVGKGRQDVVEGELGDALLALSDLADHFVETVGEPRQLVLAAHPDLDMLARRQASSGLVETRERLRYPPRRFPGREGDEQQTKQRHPAKRRLQL